MKRIILITEELSNSTPYERTLLQLFGQEIQIRSFSVRKHDYPSMPKDADLYLISCTSSDAYKEVSAYLPADKPTLPAKISEAGHRGAAAAAGRDSGHSGELQYADGH